MRPFRYFSTVLIATMIVVGCPGAHVFQGDEQTRPLTGHGGKWRIAYYEGGAYVDYKDCMRAIIKGLMTFGWIDKDDLPPLDGEVTKPYWSGLSKESRSRFPEFREEDAYSAEWSGTMRVTTRDAVLEKLQSGKIDLVIALGTWAGQKTLIASGFSETERVEKMQRLGAVSYVRKSYTVEKIGLAVKKNAGPRKHGKSVDALRFR